MRRAAIGALGIVAGVAAYLVAWPVPIDPVAWNAPTDEGLTGEFSPNQLLSNARSIDLGEHHGPEDITLGTDGFLYVTTRDGAVLKISPDHRRGMVFANTDGRPLGIEALADGSFMVANAYIGLQHVSATGIVSNVLTEINGHPIAYADDVAVAKDGRIFLTDATSKFAAAAAGDSLDASLVDILEHGGNGSVIEYRPDTGSARVLIDGLNFANGIAISNDQQYLLVAETASYRILKHWLDGPKAGRTEVLRDNLPGFPDNINNGLNGRFWIGLAAPRNELLDKYSGAPFIRKIMHRLPRVLRPQATPSSHVFAIDGDGVVLMDLQDPAARFPLLTGVLETADRLYLSSLTGHRLPWLEKQDLW